MTSRETDLAWAAGIMDGEGCIQISAPSPTVRSYVLTITVGNVHKPTVERFLSIAGVGYVKGQDSQWRQMWVYAASARKAGKVLRDLVPYLFTKKDQAIEALQFLDLPLVQRGRGARRTEEENAERAGFRTRLQQMKGYEFRS